MKPRELTDLELAELSNHWENAKVDTRKYYQNVTTAWEVDYNEYAATQLAGDLCQEHQGQYYVA